MHGVKRWCRKFEERKLSGTRLSGLFRYIEIVRRGLTLGKPLYFGLLERPQI